MRNVRPTNVNGQQALNQMLAPNPKYSGESDIKLETTAYYQDKNFLEALNGNEENSFLNRWGGEILFDNFKVFVKPKSRRGLWGRNSISKRCRKRWHYRRG